MALKMMNHPTATGYGVTRVNGQAGTLPHSTTSSGPNGAELLQIYEDGRNQAGYPYNWNDIIGFYSFNEVRRQGSGQYFAYASGGVGRLYVPSGMASEFAWTDRDQNRHTLSTENVFVSTDVNKT